MKKRLFDFLKSLRQSSFAKNSSYMVFSTVGMQLIGIATIPILSRLFSPDDFGVHGTYRSIIIIISIVLSLNLELAIVLPKEDREKAKIYLSSLFVIISNLFFLTILYFIIRFVFHYDVIEALFDSSSNWLILSVFIGATLVALTNLDQSRLVSSKMFKQIAISRFILPIAFFIIALIFYSLSFNIYALIFSQLIAYGLLWLFLQKFIDYDFKTFSFVNLKQTFAEYKEIPLYTFPNSFLNAVSINLPLILLAFLYNDTVVGYYAVGVKLVSLPVSFISSSFTQIFYKQSVDLYNSNKTSLFPFVRKVMLILLSIGVVGFFVIYLLIPLAVPFFLGSQWSDATIYLQYICFWQALMLVNSPVSSLTILLKKQRSLLVFQIFYLLFRILALWLPFYFMMGAENSIFAYAVVGVIFNLYLFVFLYKIAKETKFSI